MCLKEIISLRRDQIKKIRQFLRTKTYLWENIFPKSKNINRFEEERTRRGK